MVVVHILRIEVLYFEMVSLPTPLWPREQLWMKEVPSSLAKGASMPNIPVLLAPKIIPLSLGLQIAKHRLLYVSHPSGPKVGITWIPW